MKAFCDDKLKHKNIVVGTRRRRKKSEMNFYGNELIIVCLCLYVHVCV